MRTALKPNRKRLNSLDTVDWGNLSALSILSERAAQSDNREIPYLFADMYRRGEGVKKDMYLAIAWYLVALSRGNERAGDRLVGLYDERNHLNLPKELLELLKLYIRTLDVDQGREAAYFLGIFLVGRNWMPLGVEIAEFWLKKAAKSNHEKAIAFLKILRPERRL